MDSGALFLLKLWFYSSSAQFFYWSWRITASRWYFSWLFLDDILTVNEKYFTSHIVNFETTIFDNKNNIDMRFLEKTLEYFRIQENLKVWKSHRVCFSLPWKILYKIKLNQIIELAKILWLFT